jgi:hypothetical protein
MPWIWESEQGRRWRWYVETAERMYELGIKAGLEPRESLEKAWEFVIKLKEVEWEGGD